MGPRTCAQRRVAAFCSLLRINGQARITRSWRSGCRSHSATHSRTTCSGISSAGSGTAGSHAN
eukprot:3357287-Pyramimonas_sp.AAC.1